METLEVSVWRGTQTGEFQTFRVPRQPTQTVLDVVTHIQRALDSTLAYRFACRVGMCGSCAMTVNGVARWTCRTRVAGVARGGRLEIAPLRNLPVIKDLVCDMDVFFGKWSKAHGAFRPTPASGFADGIEAMTAASLPHGPRLHPGIEAKAAPYDCMDAGGRATHGAVAERGRDGGFARVQPDSAHRRAVDAGIECIGCAVCYAVCDVVRWNPDYLGPAALNRAWTLISDVRDAGRIERLRAVAGDAGCHACHTQMSCTVHCPKHLSPTASIAALKRAAGAAALRGLL